MKHDIPDNDPGYLNWVREFESLGIPDEQLHTVCEHAGIALKDIGIKPNQRYFDGLRGLCVHFWIEGVKAATDNQLHTATLDQLLDALTMHEPDTEH